LEGAEALTFARENLEVRKQIELQDRKEKLEKVWNFFSSHTNNPTTAKKKGKGY
jgi:hypothetical protein